MVPATMESIELSPSGPEGSRTTALPPHESRRQREASVMGICRGRTSCRSAPGREPRGTMIVAVTTSRERGAGAGRSPSPSANDRRARRCAWHVRVLVWVSCDPERDRLRVGASESGRAWHDRCGLSSWPPSPRRRPCSTHRRWLHRDCRSWRRVRRMRRASPAPRACAPAMTPCKTNFSQAWTFSMATVMLSRLA